ncbi:MAG: hypothetical protein GY928_00540 [Colwellia sp.]|nr:hypothetical protein [Colwellia sp.]
MSMYFPDLKSVQSEAKIMQKQPNPAKRYTGIVPTSEEELPEARAQLGAYMREIWDDEIAALEIELATDHNNYNEKLSNHIHNKHFKRF